MFISERFRTLCASSEKLLSEMVVIIANELTKKTKNQNNCTSIRVNTNLADINRNKEKCLSQLEGELPLPVFFALVQCRLSPCDIQGLER